MSPISVAITKRGTWFLSLSAFIKNALKLIAVFTGELLLLAIALSTIYLFLALLMT